MLSWDEWKTNNKDKISHVVGYEEHFVDNILSQIAEVSPQDVIAQYHFIDSKGKNRYIDFMIKNEVKGYLLPIELDGYDKLKLHESYDRFDDFIERQNALIAQFGVLIRYTNKKMFNEPEQIIQEIRQALIKQNAKKILPLTTALPKPNYSVNNLKEINIKITENESKEHIKKGIIGRKAYTLWGFNLIVMIVAFLAFKIYIDYKDLRNLDSTIVLPNKARNYIGQYKKVCGTVAELKNFSKGIYLNFGQKFPHQSITAVIWDNKNFAVSEEIVNTEICVEGKITRYRDKPQININHSNQISYGK